MKLWFCTASALLALAASMPLAGQTPDQAPPVFGEQIEVRVVNVEVVVTDKDGNRVTGLQPSDFRLRVDGNCPSSTASAATGSVGFTPSALTNVDGTLYFVVEERRERSMSGKGGRRAPPSQDRSGSGLTRRR